MPPNEEHDAASTPVERRRTLSPDARAVVAALTSFEQRLSEREDVKHRENQMRLDAMEQRISDIAAGFPGGDPAGHRSYHESVIERNQATTRFLRELLFKAGSVVSLGGLGWLAVVIWEAVKAAVKK